MADTCAPVRPSTLYGMSENFGIATSIRRNATSTPVGFAAKRGRGNQSCVLVRKGDDSS